MKIVIGSDHAGYDLKKDLIQYIVEVLELECDDIGPFDNKSVDYADYGANVCEKVLEDSDTRGILLCGTGIGMSIKANRYPHIYATLCNSVADATMAREHNNSNVLVMGARKHSFEAAKSMIDTWVSVEFEGGRHKRRLDKIDEEEGIQYG